MNHHARASVSHGRTGATRSRPADPADATLDRLLERAGIRLNGPRPWDLQIHHRQTARRILAQGSLGLGESYMDGWWDAEQLDTLIFRLLSARLDQAVRTPALAWAGLRARLFNLQNEARAWMVGQQHYDLGNDFFAAMLDPSMAYSCGYWADADTLADAQFAKLDLVCRKLGLQPGMRLLDIGCGWGSLMRHAAEHYGVECLGLTVSREQAAYGAERCAQLPVRFELADYRSFNPDGRQRFDRIASIGMFEHVGSKNYPAFFAVAERSLREDGLMLLHTIGKTHHRDTTDPWIDRYIFRNGQLPLLGQISDAADPHFVIEDVHNFGADYDRTLRAWHRNFQQHWPRFAERHGDRFRRMWRYYLLACAGAFRARTLQLWQLVLAPGGLAGGYRRPMV
ncbi:cyclopropane fatty acyl phospholipid synthase [Flagellatimonas centrodinii]|uniref:cyclopropane fatty acyl phospholipid synthase n=1 Tax=Flagellatimonas centrodinii TaxID=2806210 RepID=UPI001FFA7C9E|nr:cyclopropane fatty acyl phospholipid synthase [Flagellatimonas centrodinii]ULQ46678.1 cyclopropane fatty acyl phospholipid synthase [Flagellatimonas centrodinii]